MTQARVLSRRDGQLDGNYRAALADRAVARFESGDAQGAADDLSRALDVLGDDPDLLLNRGLAWAAKGDLPAAIGDFSRALLRLDADLAELYHRRGACLLSTGDIAAARADLDRARADADRADEIDALLADSGLVAG